MGIPVFSIGSTTCRRRAALSSCLHYLEEMSIEEVAAVLEIPPGNGEVPVGLRSRAVAQARGRFATECWRRNSTMTEQPWNNASRNALGPH